MQEDPKSTDRDRTIQNVVEVLRRQRKGDGLDNQPLLGTHTENKAGQDHLVHGATWLARVEMD